MDALHELVARIGLAATERFGFALAGGYAVQAHGFLARQSEDVDLSTAHNAIDDSPEQQTLGLTWRCSGSRCPLWRASPTRPWVSMA
ncbi:hypothetical protein E1295_25495 [Nonomuraea mesophila]|uniref:Nucleotidyl transferase AbiEii/AbiGii toxin family protein n=1 Tax=Nonomuraea mesophila TaxID=2530382 RepID=A0A4R5F8M9_9ACTN|nr:hypothetical protein E1295_25495 [Nonomuraea mesophila]